MLAFPVHPRYSRMLLAAREYGCVREACLVAALTQGRDLLLRNPGKDVESQREDMFGPPHRSDFGVLIGAWEYASHVRFDLDTLRKLGIHRVTARQVGPLLEQFLQIARDQGLDVKKESGGGRCPLEMHPDRIQRPCGPPAGRGNAAVRTGARGAAGHWRVRVKSGTVRCWLRPRFGRSAGGEARSRRSSPWPAGSKMPGWMNCFPVSCSPRSGESSTR